MAAIAAGVSIEAFWKATPYETRLHVMADGERQRAAYRLATFTAWHVEAFARAKKLPRLDEVLARLEGRPPKRKTGAEILAMVRQMNAALGGDDLTRGKGDG